MVCTIGFTVILSRQRSDASTVRTVGTINKNKWWIRQLSLNPPPFCPVLHNLQYLVPGMRIYYQVPGINIFFGIYVENDDPLLYHEVNQVYYSCATRYVFYLVYNCSTSNIYIRSCLLYTSPSPRDGLLSRMPSSA